MNRILPYLLITPPFLSFFREYHEGFPLHPFRHKTVDIRLRMSPVRALVFAVTPFHPSSTHGPPRKPTDSPCRDRGTVSRRQQPVRKQKYLED